MTTAKIFKELFGKPSQLKIGRNYYRSYNIVDDVEIERIVSNHKTTYGLKRETRTDWKVNAKGVTRHPKTHVAAKSVAVKAVFVERLFSVLL